MKSLNITDKVWNGWNLVAEKGAYLLVAGLLLAIIPGCEDPPSQLTGPDSSLESHRY